MNLDKHIERNFFTLAVPRKYVICKTFPKNILYLRLTKNIYNVIIILTYEKEFYKLKPERIKFIYSIFLSLLTVTVGIVFIVQVADIYYGGPNADRLHNYTVEAVKSHLVLPLIFLGIWILAIIGGFVFSVLVPSLKRTKPSADNRKTLDRLMSIMPCDNSKETKEIKDKLIKFERIRLIVFIVSLAIGLGVALFTLTYTLDPSHYSATEFLTDMIKFLRTVLVWIIAAFAVFLIAVFLDSLMIKKETQLIKEAVAKKGKGSGDKTIDKSKDRKKSVYFTTIACMLLFIILSAAFGASAEHLVLYVSIAALIVILFILYEMKTCGLLRGKTNNTQNLLIPRISVALIAIVFVVLGVVNGSASDVFIKAIKICTECIGLG